VRPEILDVLCCPECYGELEMGPDARSDALEVVDGTVVCRACGETYGIDRGILTLTRDDAEWRELQREAKSWREVPCGPDVTRSLGDLPDDFFDDLPVPPTCLDAIAGKEGEFDLRRYYEVEGHVAAWNLDVLTELLADAEAPLVFDAGVQTGWTSRLLVQHLPHSRVIANDINGFDDRGLGFAKRRLFARHGVYFERVLNDIHVRNVKAGALDAVQACMTLHHYAYPQRALDVLATALRPDGVFVSVEPIVHLGVDKHVNEIETEYWTAHGIREGSFYFTDLYQMLTNAGFGDVRIYPVAAIDPAVEPDGYDARLQLPFYPMPRKYVDRGERGHKSWFDRMASFRFDAFSVPYYVLIYASKDRDLDVVREWFEDEEVRRGRVERSKRYTFYVDPLRPRTDEPEPGSWLLGLP